jgi:hypothetical protein
LKQRLENHICISICSSDFQPAPLTPFKQRS